MNALPEINNGLWITLFIVAAFLGYRALIVRMSEKKVSPSYLFVHNIEKVNDTLSKVKYELNKDTSITIVGKLKTGEERVFLESNQAIGNYFLDFDPTGLSSLLIKTERQTVERFLA